MQLIHAIVALVAASQATAIASNANLVARSGVAEAANMKDKRGEEEEKNKEVKCFDQCSPHPGQNLCHESAPCLYISGQAKYYCGCPAGLKPDDISAGNAFRLPWSGQEGRVFVKPGVSCYNRCDNILTCEEVTVQPQCF
ncbi:hypothetical protein CFIMG_007893RA00001 [Ceratocystis fimbriata CBS 114723]|uniref:EGF-like domain-containing protein n=1 Tax=Ceratocystis fimbriata CBS 114723 TaxID=1035309 RepID=A0A2C5XB65_9PEZI|nr:hypothetical protein CFIMG_007893RA00001 [Ceratocystis fimbriata CBS 114723]